MTYRLSAFLNRVILRHVGLCISSLRGADHEHVRWVLRREPTNWTPYCGDD
jgi:hypothetical protein